MMHGARWDIVPYTRGRGFQLGVTEADKLFPHFLTCGPEGALMTCDTLATELPFLDGALDFLVMHDGSPTLLEESLRVLKDEGLLIELNDQGGFYATNKHGDPVNLPERPKKSACVVRYGGYGDQLQAANILPELRKQGYHVTFMTTPRGQEVLAEDPHIDAWFIQDTDQVPNLELTAFWKHHAARFDKFINLSESIEGTLLAIPGRPNHAWPFSVRKVELDKNYLEWTSQLAELPYASVSRFYPSNDEYEWARRYLRAMRLKEVAGQPIVMRLPQHFPILWVMSGSTQHKFYPHMDIAMQMILAALPDARIILCGDAVSAILEVGWEHEPRVQCESGRLSIRETLTLAKCCHLIIGPETGVLNACAFENQAKIVLLSHSSEHNLTKHWKNTTSLAPKDTPCYPCHRMHYSREFCPEDQATGAAICQASIEPHRVVEAAVSWHAKHPVPGWPADKEAA